MIQLQLDLSHACTAVKACRDSAICNDLIAAGKDPGPDKNMGITDVSACIADSISYIQKERFKDLDLLKRRRLPQQLDAIKNEQEQTASYFTAFARLTFFIVMQPHKSAYFCGGNDPWADVPCYV